MALTRARLECSFKMAKSKNHTAKNQSNKAHANGIKKPKRYTKKSLKGVRVPGPQRRTAARRTGSLTRFPPSFPPMRALLLWRP